ncbi:PG0541 family transporter-associated protein [Treponema parvum]|uniref:PG0541 family transporter-associated protein n=1 Tax=Treponema parvum TaxID=138851 RepID=UPI0021167F46|nr:PG0541 family transporter-associated protein [Treponema parvum]
MKEKKEKKKKNDIKSEVVLHDIPDTGDEKIKLRRLEIICSQSIAEDMLEGFKYKKIKCYTQFPSVMGSGYSVPKLGDSIWPQLNTMFIVYCTKDDAKKIRELITDLRKQYVGEGLACYVSKAKEW